MALYERNIFVYKLNSVITLVLIRPSDNSYVRNIATAYVLQSILPFTIIIVI